MRHGSPEKVPETLKTAERILASEQEPEGDLGEACMDCAFRSYCTRHLPVPNVFDLYRLSIGKKLEYYRKGSNRFIRTGSEFLHYNARTFKTMQTSQLIRVSRSIASPQQRRRDEGHS